jgi:hypothetical protein
VNQKYTSAMSILNSPKFNSGANSAKIQNCTFSRYEFGLFSRGAIYYTAQIGLLEIKNVTFDYITCETSLTTDEYSTAVL